METERPQYSIVIPVYNSQDLVAKTVARTRDFLQSRGMRFEIILVNDGSRDDSWQVIAELARQDPRIIAINLLHNCGQHAANLCGFRQSRGDWLVTMDDDLQNPPEEIPKLVAAGETGHDLVMGRFQRKRHAAYRRLGTRFIGRVNRAIFGHEKGLVLSNFRLIRRDVVDRICAWHGPYPYIPGLCLMYSSRRTNVEVEHHRRHSGQSNYSLRRILSLVATLLFNYSSYPLRMVAGVGMLTALLAFALGLYYLLSSVLFGSSVEGWTTLVVLLSFFNGIVITMLAMLGEYVVRIINQISTSAPYIVSERVDRQSDD